MEDILKNLSLLKVFIKFH